MKKILLPFFCSLFVLIVNAQDSTFTPAKKKNTIDLTGRAADHLVIQFGGLAWGQKPDSINTKGFAHSFNAYLMFDYPIKTNPKMSIGVGLGVGSDHMYFDKMYLGIKDGTVKLNIEDRSDSVHFKKYKLAVNYLEAPIEFRYTKDPLKSNKSFKFSIGVKVGTLINVHTRGKDFVDINGNVNPYVEKEASKRFFNKSRLAVTGRIGMGVFSVFGTYQVTQLYKENLAPKIYPWTVGLCISGL